MWGLFCCRIDSGIFFGYLLGSHSASFWRHFGISSPIFEVFEGPEKEVKFCNAKRAGASFPGNSPPPWDGEGELIWAASSENRGPSREFLGSPQ